MKKLLAVAMSALAISSAANANWYVQGDLGYSKAKFTGGFNELNMSKVAPSVSIGYKINELRFALDYTYYGKKNYSYYIQENATDYEKGNGSIKAQGFGFSALYDFNLDIPLKPYIGARLSLNKVKLNETSVEVNSNGHFTGFDNESHTKFGYGVLAGASYQITDNLALDAGVQLQRLASFENTKVNQYGLKVGLRYEF
ncbi:opacity family porin [Avibacterium sp. 21-599]|uniref:opacity family porin n=1 Tax=Avibacterium sp. 21-599 TaxID=2911528 RepID=UPI002245B946|nr:opacity family porin [Avibacterium sp. 21-599]MCW9719096.1 opacity family porin [Avibacterium sp. 21-599]